jgi:hypothetical protein
MKLSGRGIGFLGMIPFLLAAGGCSAGSPRYGGSYSAAEASYAVDYAVANVMDYAAEPAARQVVRAGSAGAGNAYAADGAGVSFSAALDAGETPPADGNPPSAEPERKLVRNANLRLRVPDPEAAEQPLLAAMEKHGAYAASTEIYENSRSYTIRVPRASYGKLLEEVDGMGKVLYRTERAEDVSLRYYDLEGRLNTSRELLKTFQNYLGQAKNIDEIMTVERRIAELQEEIDRTGSQFRSLANLVDYATIDLELLGPVSVSSSGAPTLGERISGLFQSFGDIASAVLVVLTGLVIYGLPAVLLLALLFWLLLGRIGLVKKLWRLAAGKGEKPAAPEGATRGEENGPA